jgi:hypothetical protein
VMTERRKERWDGEEPEYDREERHPRHVALNGQGKANGTLIVVTSLWLYAQVVLPRRDGGDRRAIERWRRIRATDGGGM